MEGASMIVSIDPGGSKDHTIAIFSNSELYRVFKTSNIPTINRNIHPAKKVIIESQYYGGNAKTLILLSHRTGMLMGLCQLHGIDYEMVMPVTWMSWHKIPIRKPKLPEMSAYKWKKIHQKHIIDKAKKLTDYDVRDDDEAAAILIGIWGIHNDS